MDAHRMKPRGSSSNVRTALSTISIVLCTLGGAQAASAQKPPLELVAKVEIPDVPLYPYSDGMALDGNGHRLFATPQGAKAVAVIDLEKQKTIKMISGIGNPHGLAYDNDTNNLLVVDGNAGDVKVFDGNSYAFKNSIPLRKGADMAVHDTKAHVFYVNNGGEKAGLKEMTITAIDSRRLGKLFEISVPVANLEADILDSTSKWLFSAIDDEKMYGVVVVDLINRKIASMWHLPSGGHRPKGLALDEKRSRLFVATRDNSLHGSIFVFDTRNGRIVTRLPIGGWTDGVFFDQKRSKIYVSSGTGYVETFSVGDGDRYKREMPVETSLLAKTSLFSPTADRLFVSVPTLGDDGSSQVIIFRPNS